MSWVRAIPPITLTNPRALYLLIGAALIMLWSLSNLDSPRKVFAPLLRALVLALVVFALAGPQRVAKTEGATRPSIVDVSASITPQMRQWIAKLLQESLKLRSDDPVLLFARATVSSRVADAAHDLLARDAPPVCPKERISKAPCAQSAPPPRKGGQSSWSLTGGKTAAMLSGRWRC